MARLLSRCGALLLITVSAAGTLNIIAPTPDRLAISLADFAHHPQPTVDAHGVESVAIAAVAALTWLVLAWLLLALVLVAASAAPGRAGRLAAGISGLLVPAAARQLLATALGVTILTGITAGTAAAAPPGPPAHAPTAISTLNLDWPTRSLAAPTHAPRAGSPTPAPPGSHDQQTAAPPASQEAVAPPGGPRRDANPPPARPGREVVVQRGDTLWGIAARHLGPAATDEQIAREWPRWWSANHQVVGDDPDLISPGQRLTPPPAKR
jgi:nucleoid-associated protein YgaU